MAKRKVSTPERVELPSNLQDVTMYQAIRSLAPVFDGIPSPKIRDLLPWMQALEIGLRKAGFLAQELLKRLEEVAGQTGGSGPAPEDEKLRKAAQAFLAEPEPDLRKE